MAIDFQKTFGANSNNVKSGSTEERPKAQLWLNIGYDSGVLDDDGKSRFVSLPTGIPLDTQELLPVNSRNREFAAFQSARNDLLSQLLEAGKKLAPGEDVIIPCENGLAIQIRRINAEAEAIAPETNQFVKKLALVG